MNDALNFTAIILASMAFILSLISLVLNLATRFSTHRIEWKPLEMEKFKDEEDSELDDEQLLVKAMELSKKSRAAKKQDPLDDILETNNF
jgi:hypothetical protein